MASVPKPAVIPTTAPAHTARAVGPSTRVAAVSTNQVDATDVSSNVAFDAAASGFQQQQDNTTLNREGSRRQQYTDPGFDRLFTANTQVFAEIFEADTKANAAKARDGLPTRSNERPVSSIIKTYENNALIISGRQHFNGTEFSFNL